MFFEHRESTQQKTFDDLEPVLEPDGKEPIHDLKRVKHPRSREALRVYEELKSVEIGYVPDPLAE